jgi:hypothetical protein
MAPQEPGTWRIAKSDDFTDGVSRACGKDGALRSRIEKKVEKILTDPERPRGGKVGGLAGLKSELVNPFVILYRVEITPAEPPGVVHFVAFLHHNDPRYDSSR